MKARLLYIDDDPALARLVERTLGRRGYVVEKVTTGDEGVARLEKEHFDVIVLDHFLPTGTGLDVLERLKSLPDIPPVVYVTGMSDAEIAVAALKAGAADYVGKITGEEFFELLGTAIDQAIEKARLQADHERAEREVRAGKERAETLLQEVNHRVANSLSLVAALVGMQIKSIDNAAVRDALGEIQGRIFAIAGVHRRLYTSQDVRSVEISEYLTSILRDLDATLKAAGHLSNLHLSAEPVHVPTDKAVSIGVIVTELVTNAFKYAYPRAKGGEIRVRFSKVEGKVNLVVEDDGVGYREQGESRGTGVGTKIVDALARGLGTTLIYEPGSPGCRASLIFEI